MHYLKHISPLILLCVSLSNVSYAEIYRWTDANGKLHFGDKAPFQQPTVETIILKPINTFEGVEVEADEFVTQKKTTTRKTVTMYSTQWCGVCKQAKAYFAANKIPYKEYDIEKNPKARKKYDQLKGRGVPLITIGKKKMHGFSVGGFNQLYKS